eukprot:scaffold6678_cov336-Prasinococcus_capsulatus_cf.AAC.1
MLAAGAHGPGKATLSRPWAAPLHEKPRAVHYREVSGRLGETAVTEHARATEASPRAHVRDATAWLDGTRPCA